LNRLRNKSKKIFESISSKLLSDSLDEMNKETNLAKIVNNIQHNYAQNNILCAGGILYDIASDKILVVQGREKWSLPKGHREAGERPYETAMREIYEETSLKIKLDETCFSKRILKSLYYLIVVSDSTHMNLSPIDTNEVLCVRWCNRTQLFSLDCNKQLKYFLKRWDQIVRQFNVNAHIARYTHIARCM
jgi:8-oxo-dGTP pyrophosphatase MutT (NUDIX family)